MKILHTSDWHLGKRLVNFERTEEQQHFLDELIEIANAQQVDAVLVAGDLFDTFNPPTYAVELFYKKLKQLSNNGLRPIIAIAGNHDSPDRIEAPDPLARECGILFAGYPNSKISPFELETGLKVVQSAEGFVELKLPNCEDPLRLLLTPYANELRLKTFLNQTDSEEELRLQLQHSWTQLAEQYCDTRGVNVLMAHLFVVQNGAPLPDEPDDEKPILHVGGAQAIYTENIPPQIQYTALGHLHRMHAVQTHPSPVYYSGSPLGYSFAEANQDKFVLLIQAEPGAEAQVEPIRIKSGKPLLRKRFENTEEALQWLRENQHCYVELTMVSDNYLTAQIQKQLHDSHAGITAILPEVTLPDLEKSETRQIDPSQPIEELFTAYFEHKHKQKPNADIMDLFKELMA